MSVKMKIVVPVFNVEEWIERCLRSISAQSFKDWECVIINDCSTDHTAQSIDSLDFISSDSRFKIVHNKKNVKALKNIVDGFTSLGAKNDPESILMAIDGDDFLFSDQSLQIISQIYSAHPQLLLTYGNWIGHPDGTRSNCRPYDNNIIANSSYRSAPFVASHLRTFKSRLWYAIDDRDLRDDSGEYFTAGWDVAFMIPMLEMAQERHGFVDHVLYCYNRINPISDFRVHEKAQIDAVGIVQGRKKYERL